MYCTIANGNCYTKPESNGRVYSFYHSGQFIKGRGVLKVHTRNVTTDELHATIMFDNLIASFMLNTGLYR